MKIVTLEMNAFYYCIQRKNLFSLVDTVAVSGVAVFYPLYSKVIP